MASEEWSGRLVGDRYAIEDPLGRGGSATVYRARDTRDGSIVAVKVLHQEFSGSRHAERFAIEIRLLREFSHPNIIPVLDAGESDERPYYVMPYVAGETLQDRLKRERRLPFDEVTRLGRALCDALGYAHERKVVHRDVKPANIMLSGGQVYLADFGIAKALRPLPGQPHSTTGTTRGTMAYMSPEQATADREIDHRSDIFSLGCVLYEMIAGQHPWYSADEARMFAMRFTEPPDSLRRHRDGVPPALERAVLKALAREPADRWQSVGGMGEGLAGLREGSRRSLSSGRRRYQPLGIGASALVVVVLVASVMRGVMANGDASCTLPSLETVDAPVWMVDADVTDGVADASKATRSIGESLEMAVRRWIGASAHRDALRSDPNAAVAVLQCAVAKSAAHGAVSVQLSRGATGRSVAAALRVVTAAGEARSEFQIDTAAIEDVAMWTRLIRDRIARQQGVRRVGDADTGSTTFASWRDCIRGNASLEHGQLDSALTRFRASAANTPDNGCALAGQAITLSLAGRRDATEWRAIAARALAHEGVRSRNDRNALRALVDRADSHFERACPNSGFPSPADSTDHILLVLRADCLRSDSTVREVRRRVSFRTSWNDARRLYERALDYSPSGFERVVLPLLSVVAPTATWIRWGWLPSEPTARYAAYPAWEGDSLVQTPIPRTRVESASSQGVPSTLGRALQEGKQLQARFARRWVERAPMSGDAHLAQALALELLGRLDSAQPGESSALSELLTAARAPSEPVASVLLLEARTRVLVKLWRLDELQAVVDSTLRRRVPLTGDEARVLGPVALLLGRVRDALPLLEQVMWTQVPLPLSRALRRDLTEFASLAAIGCCRSRLDSLEATVRSNLGAEFDASTRDRWEGQLLAMPLMLGAACRGWPPRSGAAVSGNYVLRAQQSLARHDTLEARAILEQVRRERSGTSTADVAIDYSAQEALLYRALGDTAAARGVVDAWRLSWSVNVALDLAQPSQAGAIARMLVLAHELRSTRQSTEARPLPAVGKLWAAADPWLKVASSDRPGSEILCDVNPTPEV